MKVHSLRRFIWARPRLRRTLKPFILLRRFVMKPTRNRQQRERKEMFSRIVEGTAVFRLPEFRGDYEIDLSSDLAQRLIFQGAYEFEFASLCEQWVDRDKDALDIGANVGLFTGLTASLLHDGRRVVGLEPAPRAYHLLLRNIDRNGVGNRVLALQMVASSHEGQHEVNVCRGKEEYSSCGPIIHNDAGGVVIECCPVPGTTVDAICRLHKLTPGFIKIDVEGYEWNVLAGAATTVKTCKPVILCEVSDSMLRVCGSTSGAVLSWLADMGYRLLNAASPAVEVHGTFNGEVLALPR